MIGVQDDRDGSGKASVTKVNSDDPELACRQEQKVGLYFTTSAELLDLDLSVSTVTVDQAESKMMTQNSFALSEAST